MLNKLYGDAGKSGNRASVKDKTKYGHTWATQTFEKRVKDRLELSGSYFVNLFFWILSNVCCCLLPCINRKLCLRNGINKHRKFNIALERLSKEQDIQYLIEMNRVTRLLHKATFLKR